jgi:CRISPR-associated protein Csd1
MILKALYDYYDRCGDLPSLGLELKELSFLLVLDRKGNFVRIEDRRENNTAHKFLVPKAVSRSSAPVPNFLWDNPSYVLGISDANYPYDKSRRSNPDKIAKEEAKREQERVKNTKNHGTFIDLVNNLFEKYPDRYDIRALHTFYSNPDYLAKVEADNLWPELKKNLKKNISFLIEGDTDILPAKKDLCPIEEKNNKEDHVGYCLITGKKSELVKTTSVIPLGRQATAKLVSFQIKSGYDSYGKEKGYNAPISKEAEFKFSTALKKLLSKDSRNKFLIGTRFFVFWASTNSEGGKGAEESIFNLFGFAQADDPNKNIENARKVLQSINSGVLKTSLDDHFYILGLAPNNTRIIVSYWSEQPLKQFASKILLHFEDMKIVSGNNDQTPYMGLRSMLRAVSLGGKSSEATPNLPDAIVKSIFQGYPYPYTLFASCIRRIRAEQKISITRAAILKAYLNRLKYNDIKLKVMLDYENNNQGYLCGRLFAVLDKIQAEANNIHTIKERYMNAASATPAAVFATILNLSSHHSENLDEKKKIFYEKIKQEIIGKISSDGFPVHLNLQDQGRFFVGYYHQLQEFYTPKENLKK